MWGYCQHGVVVGSPRAPGPGLGWAWGTAPWCSLVYTAHLWSQPSMMSLWPGVYVMLLGVSLLGPWEVCPGPSGKETSPAALANLATAFPHCSCRGGERNTRLSEQATTEMISNLFLPPSTSLVHPVNSRQGWWLCPSL